jgi:hypothetical protein
MATVYVWLMVTLNAHGYLTGAVPYVYAKEADCLTMANALNTKSEVFRIYGEHLVCIREPVL